MTIYISQLTSSLWLIYLVTWNISNQEIHKAWKFVYTDNLHVAANNGQEMDAE